MTTTYTAEQLAGGVRSALTVISEVNDLPLTALHLMFGNETMHWGNDQSVGFGEGAS